MTTSADLGNRVISYIDALLPNMPSRDFAEVAWRDYGQVIVADDIDEAYRIADGFASEHVQILTRDPKRALEKMSN